MKIITLIFISSLISCGEPKVSQKITKSGSGSESNSGEQQKAPQNPETSNVSTATNYLPCNQGETRLKTLVYNAKEESTQDGSNKIRAGISVTPGPSSSNTQENRYKGISSYNDYLEVVEVTENNKVIGYNLNLSFCTYQGIGPTVSNIESLQIYENIILDKESSCATGFIDAGGINIELRDSTIPFETTFNKDKSLCDSQF